MSMSGADIYRIAKADFEMEYRSQNGQPIIAGIAAPFNEWSVDLGGFVERILPGAFDATLRNDRDIAGLHNHDSTRLLGRTTSGTLRLFILREGLGFELKPPDNVLGREIVESVRRGDLTQMSFTFTAREDEWSVNSEGVATRDLIRVKLIEVSPVTFPAYLKTSARIKTAQRSSITLTGQRMFHTDTKRRRLGMREREQFALN